MSQKKLLLEAARRKRHEKYQYYVPIGKGEQFINIFASGDHFIILLSAANGVGKTRLGVNILAHLMYPCGNEWFQGKLFKNWPYLKRARIVSDPTTVKSTIVKELKDQFPVGRYNCDKAGKHFECQWRTDTGWDFDVMTYDQQVKEFESATLGLAWFDEPPPESIFKATVARMRKGGIIFITATPLTGSAWMYDSVISNPDNEAGYRTFVEADVEDACIEHGVRGFLKHSDIEKMIAQYDEEDMQARIFGKFQHLIGLVFKNFNRAVHVIEPFEINKKDFVVVEALDPHPRVEDAVMWLAINRQNTKYIIKELYQNFNKTEDLGEKIKGRSDGLRMVKRISDLSAFLKDQHKENRLSLAQELANMGLHYEKGSKARTEAIKRTRSALAYEEVNGQVIVPPELYVFSNCLRTIWEFEHWQWDEWRGKTAEDRSSKEKPKDKDDHMMENIGRILLENVSFLEMQKYALGRKPERDETQLDPFD